MSSLTSLILCVVAAYSSILSFSDVEAASIFPADIELCPPGDTNCIMNSSKNFISKYARKGSPSIAFPAIDPLHVKEWKISDNRGFKLTFRDVDITGLSDATFDHIIGFDANPSSSKFEMRGNIPKIMLRGKYSADGQLLLLPFKGDGDADITLEKVKFSIQFLPSLQTKNGKSYLDLSKLKISLEPKKISLKFARLLNGDNAFGQQINQFLNEHSFEIWSELQPSIQKTLADIMVDVLSPMLSTVAYDDFYLH